MSGDAPNGNADIDSKLYLWLIYNIPLSGIVVSVVDESLRCLNGSKSRPRREDKVT